MKKEKSNDKLSINHQAVKSLSPEQMLKVTGGLRLQRCCCCSCGGGGDEESEEEPLI